MHVSKNMFFRCRLCKTSWVKTLGLNCARWFRHHTQMFAIFFEGTPAVSWPDCGERGKEVFGTQQCLLELAL